MCWRDSLTPQEWWTEFQSEQRMRKARKAPSLAEAQEDQPPQAAPPSNDWKAQAEAALSALREAQQPRKCVLCETPLDAPASLDDGLNALRDLVRSEAGHIAYVDDELNAIRALALALAEAEKQRADILQQRASAAEAQRDALRRRIEGLRSLQKACERASGMDSADHMADVLSQASRELSVLLVSEPLTEKDKAEGLLGNTAEANPQGQSPVAVVADQLEARCRRESGAHPGQSCLEWTLPQRIGSPLILCLNCQAALAMRALSSR